MAIIEELHDDAPAPAPAPAPNDLPAGMENLNLDVMIAAAAERHRQKEEEAVRAGAQLPPSIAAVKNTSTEEFLKAMNKMPLFMTELDEKGEDGGENVALEAIKALAYEGEPHEIAQNFRAHGNDCFKHEQWKDAIELYTKALAVKCGDASIDSACYTNRAACNLELQNYRRVINDCASALKLNSSNVKAWYRSARALFALDKIDDALSCISNGLETDPENAALKALREKVLKRKEYVQGLEKVRKEREEKKKAEERSLKIALAARKIPTRTTPQPPELEDAKMQLEDPLDPSSTLSFPTVFLYPLTLQSDFIKAFSEHSSLQEQLSIVLAEPPSWDTAREYTPASVEAYMETKTGGLIKVGKKVALREVLGGGKVEVVDEVLKIMIVPKARSGHFIEEWKKKKSV
ncbi:HSP70/90 co-chaperone [Rhizina undulata]